jgi:S-DNA-T family DNA segregation ATPase FtsK/SpoIIIE
MPYLLVIIDEFAEMKEQAPDFMDKIINIARLGRTLGVHMVLATQRPAGVVTGQLNSNTNFRLCLRVVASEDSVDMLGRKDAFLIPSDKPGRCFFKVGSDIFEQFQVARVAIPFGPPTDDSEIEKPFVSVIDRHWSMAPLSPQLAPTGKKASEESEIKAMDYDMVTEQCIKAASRMTLRNKHKPWLDPMKDRYFLPDFLEDKGFNEEELTWPETPPYGFGIAPLAFLDDVVRQEQRPFYFDLLKDGSYCISGLAQSGKTNLLRSMLATLALTHNPDEMRFVVVDMGGTLRPFSELPHQTRYVGMAHANQLKALFKDLHDELQNRRQLFAESGVLDITSYRALAKEGEKMPSMFIAFDNFATIRHNPPFDVEHIKALIREGRSYGMHVAITMDRANDFEFGRLAGQFYHIALRQAREDILFAVPKNMVGSWNGIPGRCFIKAEEANKPPLELQILLPCLAEPEDQTRALEDLMDRLRDGAAKNPRWANLNSAAAEAAAQKAPANAASSNGSAETETPTKEKGQDAAANAALWDELFKVPDPATPMAPSTSAPDNQAAAPATKAPEEFDAKKAKIAANAAYWDDLFKVPARPEPAPPPAVPPVPAEAATPPPVNNNGKSAPESQPVKVEEETPPAQNGETRPQNSDEPRKKLRI